MSLVFREGLPDEVPAIASLALHSFPGLTRAPADWEKWLRDPSSLESLWVGEEDGRLVAACMLYSFGQWVGGRKIPIMGLGLVAVSPTDRRRRIAEEMIAKGFEAALARGEIATALYPFRTSFYRKLGYGLAGQAFQHRVRTRHIPDHTGRTNVVLCATAEQRRLVQAVYEEWAPRQTGQLDRTAEMWKSVWERGPSHGVVYQRPGEKPTGYAIFRYLTDGPKGQRAVDVEEIAWLDREARLGLYGWLSSLSDQWEYVLYRAHPDEAFIEHLNELGPPADDLPPWLLWFPSAIALAGPMFRIMDLEHAWASRTIQPGPAMTVALEVQDRHIPANAGHWWLRLADGGAEIRAHPSGEADLTLKMDIEVLSRLYIGALSPSQAVAAEIAEGEGSSELLARLDALLRLPKPWTFDRF